MKWIERPFPLISEWSEGQLFLCVLKETWEFFFFFEILSGAHEKRSVVHKIRFGVHEKPIRVAVRMAAQGEIFIFLKTR